MLHLQWVLKFSCCYLSISALMSVIIRLYCSCSSSCKHDVTCFQNIFDWDHWVMIWKSGLFSPYFVYLFSWQYQMLLTDPGRLSQEASLWPLLLLTISPSWYPSISCFQKNASQLWSSNAFSFFFFFLVSIYKLLTFGVFKVSKPDHYILFPA